MNEIDLPGLKGRNPLGFFAALGALALLEGQTVGGSEPTLWWTDSFDPHAVIGLSSGDDLPSILLSGLEHLLKGPVLNCSWTDVKFSPPRSPDLPNDDLRAWFRSARTPLELRLMRGLVAEGAVDGSGSAKPTHLHFAAGQQQFLDIAREAISAVLADTTRLDEALNGPWRNDGAAKNFSWAAGAERVFALRGFNPSQEKRMGVPGADALGFVGLALLPVWEKSGSARTTGCAAAWKASSYEWSLWRKPAMRPVVEALLAANVAREPQLDRRGVIEVLHAPIRRTDQGGYGSFGAATSRSAL